MEGVPVGSALSQPESIDRAPEPESPANVAYVCKPHNCSRGACCSTAHIAPKSDPAIQHVTAEVPPCLPLCLLAPLERYGADWLWVQHRTTCLKVGLLGKDQQVFWAPTAWMRNAR